MEKYLLECAVWEFTLKCNLKCLHCGSSAGLYRKDELNTQEALKLCEDLKKINCMSIALMGGEPFLRKDFWEVAKKIRELGMELSVITNGTIFDNETFKKLKELEPRAVAISIDGAKKETHEKIRGIKGCYEKSWEFINKALIEKLPVSVITTVSKINISELNEIAEQLKNKNIAWQIQTAGAEGYRFSKEFLLDLEEFYSVGLFIEYLREKYTIQELPVIGAHDLGYNSCIINNTGLNPKWTGCQAGISVIGIRSNGDILGCLSLNNDKYIEGNIRKINISEIWNGKNSFLYTRNFKKDEAGENCIECKFIEECKGGCCEMSLMKTGKFHNDPYCFYKIEHEIYKKELKNPLKKIIFKIIKKMNQLEYNRYKRIKKIFLGNRS